MKPLLKKTLLVISFCLIFVAGSKAQENDTWIELFVTSDYVEALAIANVLNFEFEEIGIIRTEETSFAIISGPFDLTKAREQLELIYASAYGETLPVRLSDGTNYQNLVWLKGSPIETENTQEPNASSEESTIPLLGLVELEIDPTSHEVVQIEDIETEEDILSSLVSDENAQAERLDQPLEDDSNQLESIEISEVQLQDINSNDGLSDQEKIPEKEIKLDEKAETEPQTSTRLIDDLSFSQINQKKRIQLALRMVGLYYGDVDGIIGSQTQAAVSLYQRRHGEEETGALTLEQRTRLFSEAESVIGFVDSMMLTDENLGLKVILPTALLKLTEISYPYVELSPIGFRDINVVLISMDGGRAGLRALHEGILRHANIPSEGSKIQIDRFRISNSDFERNIVASARLFEDRIRGVIVTWKPDQDSWMKEYSQVIAGSLGEVNKNTRFELEDLDPIQNNLQVLNQNLGQEPKLSSSGFFVSPGGDILTNYENVEDCSYITADFNHPVKIQRIYKEWNLAHLKPAVKVSPLQYAEFRENLLTYKSSIILSGYSFGGLVKEASITHGSLSKLYRDSNSRTNYILELQTTDSDFGGPIFDETGSVIGILTRVIPKGKILPADTHMAQPSNTLLNLLEDSGLDLVPSKKTKPLDIQQLNRMARDITVLIRCF